jgi:hypothetical protein
VFHSFGKVLPMKALTISNSVSKKNEMSSL